MLQLLKHTARYDGRNCRQVEAEEVPDVSEIMDVAAVPFFTLHRVGDARAATLRSAVMRRALHLL